MTNPRTLTRVMVFDANLQPKDVHVHDTNTTLTGQPILTINGDLYVVQEVS